MTEEQARRELVRIVGELGVNRGDLVYLGVDMGAVPLPSYPAALSQQGFRQREERWCDFVLGTIRHVIGSEGTIVVPTFTLSCGGPGNPYDHERTPSEVGRFTEFVRTRDGCRRSLHPIFSLASLGPLAAELVDDVGKAAFGARSPFARLSPLAAKFVCLGVPFRFSVTHLHHIEQTYGCNHRYNKAFHTPVTRQGKLVPGPWFAYVAFRGAAVRPDFSHLENRLRDLGLLREVAFDGKPFQCVLSSDVERIGYAMLEENPTAFATHNVEIRLDEAAAMASPITDKVALFSLVPTSG